MKKIQEVKEIANKYGVDYDIVMKLYNRLYYEEYLKAVKEKNYKEINDKSLEKKLYEKTDEFLSRAPKPIPKNVYLYKEKKQ